MIAVHFLNNNKKPACIQYVCVYMSLNAKGYNHPEVPI